MFFILHLSLKLLPANSLDCFSILFASNVCSYEVNLFIIWVVGQRGRRNVTPAQTYIFVSVPNCIFFFFG